MKTLPHLTKEEIEQKLDHLVELGLIKKQMDAGKAVYSLNTDRVSLEDQYQIFKEELKRRGYNTNSC